MPNMTNTNPLLDAAIAKGDAFNVVLTRHELNVLLSSLATANASEDTSKAHEACNSWLAKRFLRLLDNIKVT